MTAWVFLLFLLAHAAVAAISPAAKHFLLIPHHIHITLHSSDMLAGRLIAYAFASAAYWQIVERTYTRVHIFLSTMSLLALFVRTLFDSIESDLDVASFLHMSNTTIAIVLLIDVAVALESSVPALLFFIYVAWQVFELTSVFYMAAQARPAPRYVSLYNEHPSQREECQNLLSRAFF